MQDEKHVKKEDIAFFKKRVYPYQKGFTLNISNVFL